MSRYSISAFKSSSKERPVLLDMTLFDGEIVSTNGASLSVKEAIELCVHLECVLSEISGGKPVEYGIREDIVEARLIQYNELTRSN